MSTRRNAALSSEYPGRTSESGTFPIARERSFDDYRPSEESVAPLALRTSFMELVWVCGDCGEHYARARSCPETCRNCGAPKQHFYAPLED